MENLDLALLKSLDNDQSSIFWHSWQFDWRGRMYPSSNLLSPQGDDVSRGMLLYGEGLPLTTDVGLSIFQEQLVEHMLAVHCTGQISPIKISKSGQKSNNYWKQNHGKI